MTIVADNKVGENAANVVMADDGKGAHVGIATFLIGKKDAQKLKDAIHKEQTV